MEWLLMSLVGLGRQDISVITALNGVFSKKTKKNIAILIS
jgi:hypothetical protein